MSSTKATYTWSKGWLEPKTFSLIASLTNKNQMLWVRTPNDRYSNRWLKRVGWSSTLTSQPTWIASVSTLSRGYCLSTSLWKVHSWSLKCKSLRGRIRGESSFTLGLCCGHHRSLKTESILKSRKQDRLQWTEMVEVWIRTLYRQTRSPMPLRGWCNFQMLTCNGQPDPNLLGSSPTWQPLKRISWTCRWSRAATFRRRSNSKQEDSQNR